MPVLDVRKDLATLTLTVVGEFAVPIERLGTAWTDPRQIERFWGPPQWPATFERHDAAVGGKSAYYMTGPKGETPRGFWEWVSVNPPAGFEVIDGFAHADGTPNLAMGTTRMRMAFTAEGTGTKMVAVSTFPSLEVMETHLKMGLEEGLRAALGQLDGVLAS